MKQQPITGATSPASCAGQWLASNFKQLGVASSLNIARDYLDDLRVPSR